MRSKSIYQICRNITRVFMQFIKDCQKRISTSPLKWSFHTHKNMSSYPCTDLNDKNSSNSPQIMSNKNTRKKSIISETEKRQIIMFDVATFMPQFVQPAPSKYSSSSSPKETVEECVLEMNSEVTSNINMKFKNLKYENQQNANVCI